MPGRREDFEMQKAKWIAALTAAGLLLVLILQNVEPVETQVLFATFVMPLAILLLVAALLGLVCGVVLTLLFGKKRK